MANQEIIIVNPQTEVWFHSETLCRLTCISNQLDLLHSIKWCVSTYVYGLCWSGRWGRSRDKRTLQTTTPFTTRAGTWTRCSAAGSMRSMASRVGRLYSSWEMLYLSLLVLHTRLLSYLTLILLWLSVHRNITNGGWLNLHFCFLFYEHVGRFFALSHLGAQPVQLYQSGRGLCVSWACEALFPTDPGVPTSVHHTYKPRRQATGYSSFLSHSCTSIHSDYNT